ncbi:MAG TPA: T9SS type A sorting domain-containing protein, partial [Taishania sp.]|nr:T9SS type A sorting domain-containing protein [Taishania sp.]
DCSNNSAIPGATNQSFTATANGNYAVVVTDGACSDTSACHTITTVSLHEQAALKAIQVYPNPASSVISIASEQTEIVALTLMDNAGRIVYHAAPTNTNYQIPVAQLTNGLYVLHLETKQGTTVRLVEVQH